VTLSRLVLATETEGFTNGHRTSHSYFFSNFAATEGKRALQRSLPQSRPLSSRARKSVGFALLARGMSADLLAAFGRLDSSVGAESDRKQVCALNSTLRQDKEALISNVSDTHNNAARAGKKNGLEENLWRNGDDCADVLFDALADQITDDEFGDFEDGTQEVPPSQPEHLHHNIMSGETSMAFAVQSRSLLDIDGSIDSLISPEDRQSQEHDVEWGDFSTPVSKDKPREDGIGLSTKPSSGVQVFAIKDTSETEDWEPFEDGEAPVSNPCTSDAQLLTVDSSNENTLRMKNRTCELSPTKRAPSLPSMDERRPTNIPPPLILLQLLPQVFESLAKTNHAQDPLQRCNAVLQAHTVASHLVAGRSLRWKRDNILSQNNRIGPAAAGRKGGGMKLAAVDKNEGLKEEREVADLIQVWERYTHDFKSIVQKSGIQRPLMTLFKQLKPRPETGVGVVASRHACALCGLRRDERVPGADIDVNDSFGEFWLEYWGHRDCKGFWQTYQALLPQR
jgi:hypothetical protein